MTRWIWAALAVTATLYACAEGAPWYVIAINVTLDVMLIRNAARGPQ